MADRIHRLMGSAALVVIVVAVVGWRTVDGAKSTSASEALALNGVPTPRTPLALLLPYTDQISDSARVVIAEGDSVVVQRDPFVEGEHHVVVPESNVVREPARHVEENPLHVSATMLAGARRAALINDALVYVGDQIPGGGTLISVERDRVTVTDPAGTSRTLIVKESND